MEKVLFSLEWNDQQINARDAGFKLQFQLKKSFQDWKIAFAKDR